ncbi:MAG TPA: tetratricopeptide repeat protein [Candidatus Dormibacteraeota bacterium]|nr:tetratricopeptide repeat protein [Candidatus Dormibacteraeota bacterium]
MSRVSALRWPLIAVALALVPLAASAKGTAPAPSPAASSAVPVPVATPEPPDVAIPKLQAALKKNPNDRDALLKFAEYMSAVHRPDQALAATQKLEQLGVKTAEVYYYQGSALADLGDDKDAITALQKASDLAPTNAAVLVRLADLYLRANRGPDAERVAQRAITFNKGDSSAYDTLGMVYAAEKKYDEARKQFEQAYKVDSKDPSSLMLEAQTYIDEKTPRKAVDVYDRILAANKNNKDAIYGKAHAYAAADDVVKAVQQYDELLALDPKNVQIELEIAGLYASKSLDSDAQKAFQKAVDDHPGLSVPLISYGQYWYGKKQTAKAVALWKQALGPKGNDPDALNVLAQYSMSAGKYADAASYLNKLIAAVGPNGASPDLYLGLGQAYMGQNQFQQAHDSFRKAYDMHEDPVTAMALAQSDLKLKNFKEAADLAEQVKKKAPAFAKQQPLVYLVAAQAYEGLHQTAAAKENYKQLLSYAPKNSDLAKQASDAIKRLH